MGEYERLIIMGNEWKEGTGFFKGQKFRKNPDGTKDTKYDQNGTTVKEQKKYPQNIYRVIDKKTGKVTETFTDSEKYIWVDSETTVGELERKGASEHPSLAKKVYDSKDKKRKRGKQGAKRKQGKKASKKTYSKGGGVRKPKY